MADDRYYSPNRTEEYRSPVLEVIVAGTRNLLCLSGASIKEYGVGSHSEDDMEEHWT